jgi:hypothetical protein
VCAERSLALFRLNENENDSFYSCIAKFSLLCYVDSLFDKIAKLNQFAGIEMKEGFLLTHSLARSLFANACLWMNHIKSYALATELENFKKFRRKFKNFCSTPSWLL